MDGETLKATNQAIETLVENSVAYSADVADKLAAANQLPIEQKLKIFNDTAQSAIDHTVNILASRPDGEVDLGDTGKYFVNMEADGDNGPHSLTVVRRLPELTPGGIYADCRIVLDDYSIQIAPDVRLADNGEREIENLGPMLDAEETLKALDEALLAVNSEKIWSSPTNAS